MVMKKNLFLITTGFVFLVSTNTGFAQKKNQLEGVWKVVEVIVPSAIPVNPPMKDTTISNPGPALVIFTKGYYSILGLQTTQPRVSSEPPKDPNNLTDAEKIARFTEWSPFVANSGTYEIKGSTVIRHPIVAKSADVMNSQTPLTDEFKLEGANTLRLNPAGNRSGIRPRTKWIRVE
jgi:hypothetical protein